MRVFEPAYWTLDFNTSASASLITPSADEMLTTMVFRSKADLVGLIWNCEDTVSHPLCRYENTNSLWGNILEFDLELTNLEPLTADVPPTLAIELSGGSFKYIHLLNYATDVAVDGMSAHIRLEFSSVRGGWESDEDIDWASVQRVFFSLTPVGYDVGQPGVPLASEVVALFHMTNIEVSGPEVYRWDAQAPAHQLRLTDGYDDSYHLTPKRIVDASYSLGYRDWYNIYIGVSHHHSVTWSETEERWIVDPTKPVFNEAARAWFDDLFTKLVAAGFLNIVLSFSFEVIHYQIPDAWRQRDHEGTPAESGWTPPTNFITPTRTDALDYIVASADYLIGRVDALGGDPVFQLGEPWWWGGYLGWGPCIYDDTTTALYTTETSNPVPTPYLTTIEDDFSAQTDFVNWLGEKLGQSSEYIVTEIKTLYPTLPVALLIFTPQIGSSALTSIINFPSTYWEYPAFDILQVEDYDWVSIGDWTNHQTTWVTAFDTLGYPPDKVQYFSGFVLLPEDADTMWPYILAAVSNSYSKCSEVFVWARPQLWRDHIVWNDSEGTSVNS